MNNLLLKIDFLKNSKFAQAFLEVLIVVICLCILEIYPSHHIKFLMAILVISSTSSEWLGLKRILPNTFGESDLPKVIIYSLICTLSVFVYLYMIQTPLIEALQKSARFLILISYANIVFRVILKRNLKSKNHSEYIHTLVIGAGNAGEQIIRQLKKKNEGYKVLALIDDDPAKQYKTLFSIPVEGSVKDIPAVIKKHNITLALITIPSANHKQISQIVQLCLDSGVTVKTLPDTFHVLNDTVNFGQFRDINIEDLLTRKSVDLDTRSISDYISKRHVLITGAGGSIGSELSFQACKLKCQEITIVDNNEFGLYEIDLKLRELFPLIKINTFIGDVRNLSRLNSIFEKTRPQVVFHAAAYKHVPMMENNPVEAVQTNIKGSFNVLKASQNVKAEQFILISTDKAVNPTNIMGTTKRLAEIVLQLNQNSVTKTNIVRFGNVLNSRGSVIPRFLEQIKRGGPITLTHPDITRYFMSIPEAAQLVLKTSSFERHGEIFILDMGESVRIYDMAKNLIRLHGLIPDKDVEIKLTGLRPGEKLYEELLADSEKTTSTPEPKIRAAKTSELNATIEQIDEILSIDWNHSKEEIIVKLRKVVPEYVPDSH